MTQTILHKYHRLGCTLFQCFPHGKTVALATGGKKGGSVYEVNVWLWQFGCGKQRLGGLTVEETEARLDAAVTALNTRGVEDQQCRRKNCDVKNTLCLTMF